MKAKHF